jgi:amino acid efflux transporter
MALLSIVLMAGLLILTGWHLVVPAALALVAIAVTVIRKIRNRARDRGADHA